jgi:hypothetical protein
MKYSPLLPLVETSVRASKSIGEAPRTDGMI